MNAALHLVSTKETERANAIEKWLASYSTTSGRRSMESTLRAVMRAALDLEHDAPVRLETFPWEALADSVFFQEIVNLVTSRYTRKRSPKYVIAMRALLQSLVGSGLADYWPAAETLARNKTRVTNDDLPSMSFSTEDLWRIMLRCRQDPSPVKGSRDLALISAGLSTGARRAELVTITLDDLDMRNRSVNLAVKGGGTRTASLHTATVEHLEQWLTLRGSGNGALFPSLRKGGRIREEPLSEHQYWKLLVQRSAQADIEPAVKPHDLRRWYVSSLLDNGIDIFQVMRAVGHHHVQTTFRYDRRQKDRLRDVIDALALPGLGQLDALEE